MSHFRKQDKEDKIVCYQLNNKTSCVAWLLVFEHRGKTRSRRPTGDGPSCPDNPLRLRARPLLQIIGSPRGTGNLMQNG